MVKAIIVLVIGLALLGGAGYGGWILYNQYFGPQEDAPPPPPPPPPPTSFIRMTPVVVPMIGDGRVEQFVTFVVSIEVLATEQPRGAQLMPRLRDQFIRDLYDAVDRKSIMRGALVDLAAAKKVMRASAVKVLGEETVRDVLVQVVTQRNL